MVLLLNALHVPAAEARLGWPPCNPNFIAILYQQYIQRAIRLNQTQEQNFGQ
jgi:hypothetical protein